MATMNNFRAEDMPSAAKKKDDAKPTVEAEESKVKVPKKAPAKKVEPKVEEVVPEPRTDVEGDNTPAVDVAEEETN
jgi:hypothetical protein